ncbi:MAG: glycosyltransferase family 4 protein [Clostridia bacterium]|nr:glycosyltransferase family 4 protein [Clostridia bacterium]
MKVIHLIGGGDIGGAKIHVLSLVKELSKYIDVKIISFRPGIFADEARSMGIDIEVVKTGNFFSDLKKVVSIIKQGNYQVIHPHGAKANMFAVALKHMTKLPTVTTVHSDYKLDYLQSIVKRLSFGLINTIALRLLDNYIGVSKNFKDMLIERKFDPEKIYTVYNGIDFNIPVSEYSRSEFSTKYGLNLTEADIAVGILARLHPVKGLSIFVNAAKEVLTRNPSVKFLIGGDGEERKSLEQKVASLGISNNVYFVGWVKDPYEFMSCIDINVLASLSESFPYVILEGTRLKKATISSDVGGISDLIESGVNGYLFDVGDHTKLAQYILDLAEDSKKRREMGEKLYEKARSHFSLESMCKTQLNIYKTILDRRK